MAQAPLVLLDDLRMPAGVRLKTLQGSPVVPFTPFFGSRSLIK